MKDFEALLEWKDGTEEYEKKLLEKVLEYESIIIFGAGIGGKMTLELLEKNHLRQKVKAFSDNNPDKVGTIYYGFPVIKPDMIKAYSDKTVILISSTAFDIISNQLVKYKVDKEDIYYFQPAGMSLESRNDMQFIREHIVEFSTVYNLLMDDTSRLIYSSLLNYRISKDAIWLQRMEPLIYEESDQYFDKELLSNYEFEEAFIDGGGYNGDTIDSFYEHYPNWKGAYYSLEAVGEIYAELCRHVDELHGDKKVIPMNYAIWNEKGKLYFDTATYGNGGGSRVSNLGVEVKCDSLDNLFQDKVVSFIKMDIEGAERNGLIGARNVIKKNAPILTICIYHKPEDFFDIPLLIEMIKPGEYEFYIRQYRYGQSETVLYAMPKSRKQQNLER